MTDLFTYQKDKILSISELTQQVKELLEDAFRSVWASGEISNFKRASSGHLYLTLKDPLAQLPAVMWRSAALRLRFDPQDGLGVIVRGHIEVYPPHGKYQFIIEELQPKGVGALELAFRQLQEKLSKLGYFDPRRKKPLPRFPRRLALVTSPTGAAIRDMLQVLAQRWSAVEIWVCPVPVQGEGAAERIAAAIRYLNRLGGIDVMIVGRGGGSLEDLWAFNEEAVARAIFDSAIPVISAVGHEVDVTIADLVADFRALTPTHAATHVVPSAEELLNGVRDLETRLHDSVRRRLEQTRGYLDDLARRRIFRLPLERIHAEEQRLDDWSERLRRSLKQRLDRAGNLLQSHAARLETLSPLNVLARGYSLTRREADRAVVRSPEQVQLGDRLVTTVQHGEIISRVEEV